MIEKLDLPIAREWYARKAIENGWSRNILVHQIESRLHLRIGEAQTNFARTLPPPQSELAQQVLKDPYTFDFLGLGEEAQERDLERALLEHLRAFLPELGLGFAFVGSQYHLEVGGQDFYLDLLFYHFPSSSSSVSSASLMSTPSAIYRVSASSLPISTTKLSLKHSRPG